MFQLIHCYISPQDPPKIHKLYKFQFTADRLTLVGDAIALVCNASGLPSPHLKWQKFGSGPFNYDYLHRTNINALEISYLIFNAAKFSHSGNYTCLAQNRNGIAKSNITLIVYGTLYIHTYRYVIYIYSSLL